MVRGGSAGLQNGGWWNGEIEDRKNPGNGRYE